MNRLARDATLADVAEAFAAGEADLAIVRGDNDELAATGAVVQGRSTG